MRFHTGSPVDGTDDDFMHEWPADRVSASLRPDGIYVQRENLELPAVSLGVVAETVRRQRVGPQRGWRLRARIGQPSSARAVLTVWLPGRERPITVSATRRFGARGTWRRELRLPRVVLRAAARKPLHASLIVAASRSAGLARAVALHQIGPLRLSARRAADG